MIRLTNRVGNQPILWLWLTFPLRKCAQFRFLVIICIIFIGLRLISNLPSDPLIIEDNVLSPNDNRRLENCTLNQTQPIFPNVSPEEFDKNDTRPRPSIERLYKLFSKLISYEDKFRSIFTYLGIFRFNDIRRTLRPFANHTQHFQDISCLLQRYVTVSNNGHIDITPSLIGYFKQISTYLSDGLTRERSIWNETPVVDIPRPVIVLAANDRFYDTLQASMRTVDQYLKEYTVAIYDLGFNSDQVKMIRENCRRCIIIPFPFAIIEPLAPHIRNLANFAWKPIVAQDAVQRFGSIIYGDTSVRYQTSNFDRLLIDNNIRGFSCRELPGHYLSCFTQSDTFTWFGETPSAYDDVYIAEAGFLAITDNFLSRLVLKTWATCALDLKCISPEISNTVCKRLRGTSTTHRYDQSAMVTALSFYFFPNIRQADKSSPAPYDMFTSIQQKIADVRRFAGDPHYFVRGNKTIEQPNSSRTIVKA